jgi:hypothetical protein
VSETIPILSTAQYPSMRGRTACPISITHDTARQISAFRSGEALQTPVAAMLYFQVNQRNWAREATPCLRQQRRSSPTRSSRLGGSLSSTSPKFTCPAHFRAPTHIDCRKVFLDLPVHTSCTRGPLTSVLNQKFATSGRVLPGHCIGRSVRWKKGCHRRTWSIGTVWDRRCVGR